ncbi:MAG: FtsX-like permease family protein, partial [Chloroflexota bacterium]|nr:FtsX-like permease family protein [Chloroflexota bacterium]
IVAAALGVGDTLDTSVRNTAYQQLQTVDQTIVTSLDGETDANTGNPFPETAVADIENRIAGVDEISGLLPALQSRVAAVNEQSQLANSQVNIVGLDPTRLEPFGGLETLDGDAIDLASMPAGTVVISETLSQELDLEAGSQFTIFVGGQPTTLSVGAVSMNQTLIGYTNGIDGSVNDAGIGMPLAHAQELLGQPGMINQIWVTQGGSIEKSKEQVEDVTDKVSPLLDGSGFGINATKAEFIYAAEGISSGFTSIFIVLGLFSIAAGILLIVLIFTMLAAERRSEMGMARAVGQRRMQLVQQFVSEGAGYALLSGFVGLLMGVAATFLIARVMNGLFGDQFPIKANVSPTSLVSAYALGVFITFATVVGASWKVSRLNIVSAVRDIPDVQGGRRRKRTLLWGILLTAAGALMLLSAGNSAFLFYGGLSLTPFGIAIILVWFGVPGRVTYTAVAIWLLFVWLLPDSVFNDIFGEKEGEIEMFFLSGIFLVIGTTLLIVQNTSTLLRIVTALGGIFKNRLASVKLAVAYPGQARGRTGMAIAMFSLIIFSLVMIATITQNLTATFLDDEALAGWNITAQGNAGQAVDDFPAKVASADIDQSEIQQIGKLTQPSGGTANMRPITPTVGEAGTYFLYRMDETFIDTTEWQFDYRAEGYDSDEAIVEALKSDSSLVVMDVLAATGNDFGPPPGIEFEDFDTGSETFAPIQVEIQNADGSGSQTFTVIGLINPELQFLFGMYGTGPNLDAVIGDQGVDTYFIKTATGADSEAIARAIEGQVVQDGVKVTSIQSVLEDAQRIFQGFLYVIQGFMGLGLFVGLAAVGVISFRSVVERRQQIGMLRAMGFQKNMVSSVF